MLFSRPLDRRYQIQFDSTNTVKAEILAGDSFSNKSMRVRSVTYKLETQRQSRAIGRSGPS